MKERALAAVLVLSFILTFAFAGDIQRARGQDVLTVEGVWEITSVNFEVLRNTIGTRLSISRKGDSYEVKWINGRNEGLYSGSSARIARTDFNDLGSPLSSDTPPAVLKQVKGQMVPVNVSYTLSTDGNTVQRECDYIHIYYLSPSLRYHHYEIQPGYIKSTLKRVSGPLKAEDRSDRAYQANCGQVDPNRTTPFPPDHEFCPGNLVCMTNFCGGGMGCPYVCCPKGLPYLNHCNCKCYATSDFECHSYSYCREKLR